MPVAILVGGLATRLRPITKKIPKALVDVAGKPFISRQLENLKRQGIFHVILCLGYLGEQVEAVVGDGASFGMDILYSWDGPSLLGTGGALKQALPLLGPEFFVLYGDSYLPIDFRAVEQSFRLNNKPALMTVLKNENQWDTSNVFYNDNCILNYDKNNQSSEMEYIDYGLGIISASVLKNGPEGEQFDLADVYHTLSTQGLLAGHEVVERFYEIGSHKGLEETIEYFKKGGR